MSSNNDPKTIEEMRKAGRMPIALGKTSVLTTSSPKDLAAKIMRTFDTGATRHSDEGKLDFEGFLSPHVLKRYAEYLNEHRTQADGKVRASDNWQQGIPLTVYMKSMLRHLMDVWVIHRQEDYDPPVSLRDAHETALCALMFNTMGYLFEILKEKAMHPEPPPASGTGAFVTETPDA